MGPATPKTTAAAWRSAPRRMDPHPRSPRPRPRRRGPHGSGAPPSPRRIRRPVQAARLRTTMTPARVTQRRDSVGAPSAVALALTACGLRFRATLAHHRGDVAGGTPFGGHLPVGNRRDPVRVAQDHERDPGDQRPRGDEPQQQHAARVRVGRRGSTPWIRSLVVVVGVVAVDACWPPSVSSLNAFPLAALAANATGAAQCRPGRAPRPRTGSQGEPGIGVWDATGTQPRISPARSWEQRSWPRFRASPRRAGASADLASSARRSPTAAQTVE